MSGGLFLKRSVGSAEDDSQSGFTLLPESFRSTAAGTARGRSPIMNPSEIPISTSRPKKRAAAVLRTCISSGECAVCEHIAFAAAGFVQRFGHFLKAGVAAVKSALALRHRFLERVDADLVVMRA